MAPKSSFDPAKVGTVLLAPSEWWRVYSSKYPATAFNASSAGNARFSPLVDTHGTVVPTMYLGQTPAVALMETVLHDCPSPSSGFILTLPSQEDEIRRMGSFEIKERLLLADFSAIGLRRLDLKRSDVIDSNKTEYPSSRELATAVYTHRPEIQGIQWTSRQDDRGSAVVLFGSRIKDGTIDTLRENLPLNDGIALDALVDLLEKLDAQISFL